MEAIAGFGVAFFVFVVFPLIVLVGTYPWLFIGAALAYAILMWRVMRRISRRQSFRYGPL